MPYRRVIPVIAVASIAAACSSTHPAANPSASQQPSRPTHSSFPTRTQAGASCSLEPWHLDHAISRAVAVVARGGIVLAGGLTTSGSSTDGVVLLDPSSGRQTPLPSLATATHDAGGASIGSDIYIFGGGESATTNVVQRIDATGSQNAGTLPQPRSDLSVTVAGGKTIVVGGYDGSRLLSAVLSTTDGTHFSNVASLPQPLRYAAVASIGSTVYVLGGTTGSTDSSDVQSIDIATGKAAIIGHLPERLSHAVAVSDGTSVWVFGGRARGAASRAIYRFDPSSGMTTVAGSLPIAVSDSAAVLVDGRAYIIGGEANAPRNTVIGCALP